MPETTALGAAMVAGAAEGVAVWSLHEEDLPTITTDTFTPSIQQSGQSEDGDFTYNSQVSLRMGTLHTTVRSV